MLDFGMSSIGLAFICYTDDRRYGRLGGCLVLYKKLDRGIFEGKQLQRYFGDLFFSIVDFIAFEILLQYILFPSLKYKLQIKNTSFYNKNMNLKFENRS